MEAPRQEARERNPTLTFLLETALFLVLCLFCKHEKVGGHGAARHQHEVSRAFLGAETMHKLQGQVQVFAAGHASLELLYRDFDLDHILLVLL